MLVSRKNLALIHLIPREAAAGIDTFQARHKSIEIARGTGAGHIVIEPLPKGDIQCGVARAGHESSLFDEVLVGTESDILHTI